MNKKSVELYLPEKINKKVTFGKEKFRKKKRF